MAAVSPLDFPPSRTVAKWWQQLAPFQPQAFWLGHLRLHRIEARAAWQLPGRLDPLALVVLRALALISPGTLPDLDERLHLGSPLLRQLLRRLEREQLVRLEENGTWSLTVLGRQGLDQGSYLRTSYGRRIFYFVDSEQPTRPPHFVKFQREIAAPTWPGVDGCRFEPELLHACVARPVEWKQRFGFPLDVQQILGGEAVPPPATRPSQAWQQIMLDRVEHFVAALVLVPQGGGDRARLLGFAVERSGWRLQADEPAFLLEADWQEVFPELAVDLPPDQWRHAWREWCQPRGLPLADVEACILERQGCRLRVLAPPRLVERLRAARSDVFKSGAWLLAGTGRFRAAVRIELAGKIGE